MGIFFVILIFAIGISAGRSTERLHLRQVHGRRAYSSFSKYVRFQFQIIFCGLLIVGLFLWVLSN